MHQSSSTYRPTANASLSAAVLRFAFAGKETDLETGLRYFGARYSTSFRDVSWQRPQASLGALLLKRYYDADLTTGWLSVDPMADKYPSISPYAYCVWNPVKLVDPDGREIWIIGGNGNRKLYTPISISGKSRRTGVEGMIDQIYSTKAGKFVIQKLINSDSHYGTKSLLSKYQKQIY